MSQHIALLTETLISLCEVKGRKGWGETSGEITPFVPAWVGEEKTHRPMKLEPVEPEVDASAPKAYSNVHMSRQQWLLEAAALTFSNEPPKSPCQTL